MTGPATFFSRYLHDEKYRLPGETFRDSMNRVANALQDNAAHYHVFREILLDMRFMPGGRIQAAMGSPKAVTPYNCYVSGTIPDSFVEPDNPEKSSIMHRAAQAARTMRMGGGIGYDFSTLRPEGALIKKLQSNSGGPLSFMPIFDAVCKATSSSGNRRGAQMGVLRIDHPDIWRFIHEKHGDAEKLSGFNVSTAVTDDFMDKLAGGKPFDLTFNGQHHSTIDTEELWEALMRSTWDWGDPGVLFIDVINRMNNLWYCEKIAATNPCGEQPLPPFGACLLGSFNLVRYVRSQEDFFYFDWDQFTVDIEPVVRAMDNVVDNAIYPLPEQEAEAKNKRRMGIGVTGLANAAEVMGFPYGSEDFLVFENEVLQLLNHHCYMAGIKLAQEKGPFPYFNDQFFPAGQFIKTLDPDVHSGIRKYGLRNSHYTSIAPTGTISLAADNVSSSIEPAVRWKQRRSVIMKEGRIEVDLYDYGFANWQIRGKRSIFGEVSAQEHIDVLVAAQKHVDSSCSKTVNCDGSMPWEDFKNLYIQAYNGGAKGCTTFNKDGKKAGIFRIDPEPSDLSFPELESPTDRPMTCEIDPMTGRRSCE